MLLKTTKKREYLALTMVRERDEKGTCVAVVGLLGVEKGIM